MRQWRVGTFSMGLLLFCTGIGLLYAQFQPTPVVSSILKWWPVIFIILGVEVLLQSYLNKGEESRIKYDIFSIFIIFFIVMGGMGLQVASKAGLINYIQENINAKHYILPANHEIALDKDIQKVVVEAGFGPHLKVRTGTGDSIQCHAEAEIRAQSEAQARQLLQGITPFNTRRNGHTLYLNLGFSPANNSYCAAYSLILPERLAVEVEYQDASLEITMGQIANDWLIRGDGDLNITLAPQSNLMLYALVPPNQQLKGNINWTSPEGKLLKVDDLQKEKDWQEEYRPGEEAIQAQAQLGEGGYKMTIIHQRYVGNEISVNQLP
ncbi:DUF5668 domain-containing protein [Syntrophomonas wolfei]|uniref:DUF5668 domain-containing protein n=1 Tax=Syntrophomonas wolfei TaxID=863 RepID=UPI0023F2E463|nr:DUF5668 domain-containing protein [Syntrophomonas wolfei]